MQETRGNDSIPGSRRSPGRGNGNSLQYFCLGNSMGRSLEGYSPWVHKELDLTERLSTHLTLEAVILSNTEVVTYKWSFLLASRNYSNIFWLLFIHSFKYWLNTGSLKIPLLKNVFIIYEYKMSFFLQGFYSIRGRTPINKH